MVDTHIDNKIKSLIDFAPTFKSLFAMDVTVTITDREKILLELQSNEFPINNHKGRKLNSDDPMYQAIHENRKVILQFPKDKYGFSFRTIAAPITDKNGVVVGCIAISRSLDDQENLVRAAEQVSASSEEISLSTSEMSSLAGELRELMDTLQVAHNEMNKQMNETEKILELINSIAKSSRILGLNAGIEAARSGEHGKGFSIVAREITKLADQSAESVDQIRQLLNLVREKVDHVDSTVVQTVEISEQQSNSITEILKSIQHFTEVAVGLEEMAKKV